MLICECVRCRKFTDLLLLQSVSPSLFDTIAKAVKELSVVSGVARTVGPKCAIVANPRMRESSPEMSGGFAASTDLSPSCFLCRQHEKPVLPCRKNNWLSCSRFWWNKLRAGKSTEMSCIVETFFVLVMLLCLQFVTYFVYQHLEV